MNDNAYNGSSSSKGVQCYQLPLPLNMSNRPHFALVASAGMGHVNPMTCLAASLSSYGCEVTFIYAEPTVSLSESAHISKLLSLFPKIQPLVLPLVEFEPSDPAMDPFLLRFEGIIRSAHHLPYLLCSRPPITALVVDISVAYAYIPIAKQLNVPCHILFISTALMLSVCAVFSRGRVSAHGGGTMDIPGLWTIPVSSLPSPLRDPNHQFTKQFVENGRILHEADGILVPTFCALEPEALAALNDGRVAPGLPPTVAIGPQRRFDQQKSPPSPPPLVAWLDQQPTQSVLYVSFGNRTAMSREQIKELGAGLDRSQCRFLWVLKTKIVDKDEGGEELEEVLGEGYIEGLKGRGLVVNGWVEQEEVLSHRAVGGFLNHCGSNSVFEAASAGVRMLGWASGGDQRVNAEVVRRSGLGIWMEEWGWGEVVVSGEEIGKKVREMMEDEELKLSAKRLGEEAAKAIGVGGSSRNGLEEFIKNASSPRG
ncbi:putative UDP-glycosyltransferase 708A6 [Iris pallida]|uniref:Sugar phosphate/phosphate translocator n=1 Tax=Iris pallida TaxID=29817 RepID=A0AAX6FZ65_IRIPA|nr:putative sugar phosphate/phosphate translocator [Iris pallida]KAJ6825641.1 putative UDP-glycosyltransferase 708A6 [Iris pallida]KAJ6825642.1 putative UDP-glycosyltransferase 708A6 [Iris pallida]